MNESVTSENGEYIAINQGDENFVVYQRNRDGSLGLPVWDMWSHKDDHEEFPPPLAPPNPTIPDNPSPQFPDVPSVPSPTGTVGTPIKIAQNVNPIGMSYWRNINQHRGQDILKVFLAINDELVLFTINKRNLQILNQRELKIHHTGEGCYFSAIQPDIFYVPREDTLYRINVETLAGEAAWRLTDGNKLWQCHSNYNDDIHSATIQDANYNFIKWGVSVRGETKYYDLGIKPDECQIDKSGNYLIVKENDINRIIHLNSGGETFIPRSGRLGHSDTGFACFLGENDQRAGGLNLIYLDSLRISELYTTGIWNMGYVSFTNAKPGAIESQNCLLTTPNELILVKLDGSKSLVVCPNLSQSQEYEHRAKANLCPNGEFAAWTAFVNGSLNAYMVRVPSL